LSRRSPRRLRAPSFAESRCGRRAPHRRHLPGLPDSRSLRPRSTASGTTRRQVSRRATTAAPSSSRRRERERVTRVFLWYAAGVGVRSLERVPERGPRLTARWRSARYCRWSSTFRPVIRSTRTPCSRPSAALALVMLVTSGRGRRPAPSSFHRPADRLVLRIGALGSVSRRNGCSGGPVSAAASGTSRCSRRCPSSWSKSSSAVAATMWIWSRFGLRESTAPAGISFAAGAWQRSEHDGWNMTGRNVIIFVRHGQTEKNREGRLQGRSMPRSPTLVVRAGAVRGPEALRRVVRRRS